MFFVIEKSVEDVKQKQKDVPDLVESIMRPTGLAKEELRRILMNMNQFRHKIQEIRDCSFQMSGKIQDSRRRLPAGTKWLLFSPLLTRIHLIMDPKAKKCGFGPVRASYTSAVKQLLLASGGACRQAVSESGEQPMSVRAIKN